MEDQIKLHNPRELINLNTVDMGNEEYAIILQAMVVGISAAYAYCFTVRHPRDSRQGWLIRDYDREMERQGYKAIEYPYYRDTDSFQYFLTLKEALQIAAPSILTAEYNVWQERYISNRKQLRKTK